MLQVRRRNWPWQNTATNRAFEALPSPVPSDSWFQAKKSFHKVLPSLPGAVLIAQREEQKLSLGSKLLVLTLRKCLGWELLSSSQGRGMGTPTSQWIGCRKQCSWLDYFRLQGSDISPDNEIWKPKLLTCKFSAPVWLMYRMLFGGMAFFYLKVSRTV